LNFLKLFIVWGCRDDLKKDLVLPDHAELVAGAFLDGFDPLLQVANLGIEALLRCRRRALASFCFST